MVFKLLKYFLFILCVYPSIYSSPIGSPSDFAELISLATHGIVKQEEGQLTILFILISNSFYLSKKILQYEHLLFHFIKKIFLL